jgi:hypothetical protein
MRFALLIPAATLIAMPGHAAPPTDADLLLQAIPPTAVQARLSRYAKAELRVRGGGVPEELQPMLEPLRRAADAIDRAYWDQVSPEGWTMLETLQKSANPDARQLARLLALHYGPWDSHQDDAPFIGRQHRPAGAAFYPPDASAREIDDFIAKHPEAAPQLWSSYTVVQRKGRGFEAIPYSKAYAEHLKVAAGAMKRAADAYKCSDKRAPGSATNGACKCAGFADFLRARADSLLADTYQKSELLWMDQTACPLDFAIGPYEYYDDRLLGLKTAFEAIVYYRDAQESARFAMVAEMQPQLAAKLKVPDHVIAKFDIAKTTPVQIADVLYTSGDARAGYQIRAFALPNDEAVRKSKGTKNVVLRNVVRAKFDALARPVAQRIFEPELADLVTFDAYYQFLVTWHLSHSLQAQPVEKADGSKVPVRQALRARYDLLSSLQGEVVALLNDLALTDMGVLQSQTDVGIAATYLASLVDAARLSEASPQTLAKCIVYNYLAKTYAFRYDASQKTFAIGKDALRPALAKLAEEVLTVLANGDYEGAGRLILQYGPMPGELREKITAMGDLPVDILPSYVAMPESGAAESQHGKGAKAPAVPAPQP